MEENEINEKKPTGNVVFAFAWMMALSLFLSLLPIIGPFIVGVIGGRRARKLPAALAAGILPVLFMAGILYIETRNGLEIKGQTYYLPPATLWMQVLAFFSGVFAGVSGKGTKIAGLVLLIGSIVFFQREFLPVINGARMIQATTKPSGNEETHKVTGESNLKSLYNAVMVYASAWDDTLPPAKVWMTALSDPTQRLAEENTLHAPGVEGGSTKYGYAMNDALDGKRLADVKEKATTPLFYESSNLDKDAHDPVTSLPQPGRHGGQNYIVFLDGHVELK